MTTLMKMTIFLLKQMIETLDESDNDEDDVEMNDADIVIDEDEDEDIAEGEEEAFEDAEDFND